MFGKLEDILKRYKELEKLTTDEKIVQDIAVYQKYAKELARIRGTAVKYEKYKKMKSDIAGLKEDLASHKAEDEMAGLIEEEIQTLSVQMQKIDEELEDSVFECDSDSAKNVIVEIRAGTGGVEAALFAGELYRMYMKYAANRGWGTEILSSSTTEKGGIKEIIFSISGKGVYGTMKYESGTHRVQRVPETESSGRVHTSAATVAVLPEAEDVDIKINQQDVKVDVYRSSGAGGQHVNVTDSAVRLTHLPTGLVVTCQDERSQHKNKAKAMRVLRTRLYEKTLKEQKDKRSSDRKTQVGSGDRSEKIRTYNFPDSRVTDHRIGFTVHKLDAVLGGDLDEILNALKKAERMIRRGEK